MDLGISLEHFSVPTHQSRCYQCWLTWAGWLDKSPPQISGGCWSFNLHCWGLTSSLSHQERKYIDQHCARGNSSFPCPSQSTGSVAPLETFHREAEHPTAVESSSLWLVQMQHFVTVHVLRAAQMKSTIKNMVGEAQQ